MKKSYPDIPVPCISDDMFDVKIYVNSLAGFIKACDTPMTIAIQGDWGSGKTSMMNMIKEQLGENVLTAWFNTWQFSQFGLSSQLSYSFLSYLTEEISSNNQELLKNIGRIALGIGKFMSKVAVENFAGGVAADAIDSLSDTSFNYAKEIIKLKEKFEAGVQDKLEKTGKERVVIFVDDLDRVSPEIAVELLETLKLFVDVKSCVFVLAIDYAVVTQGIRKKYGDYMTEEKGKSFFDKIIQLPFKMPVGLYNLDKYVKGTLEDFQINVEDDEKELEIYKGLILSSIGQNPRTLKRLFNSFKLIKMIILSNNGTEDKDTNRILFGILCMQMAFEELYNYVVANRNQLDEIISTLNSCEALVKAVFGDKETDNTAAAQMLSFWNTFLEAIQLDDDISFSDTEIENFKRILSFSSITAHQSASEGGKINFDKRYTLRAVVKQLLSQVNMEFYKGFKLYQSNSEERACIYKYYRVAELKNEICIYVDIIEGEYIVEAFIQNKQKSYRERFVDHVNEKLAAFSSNIIDEGSVRVQIMNEEFGANVSDNRSAENIGQICFEKIKGTMSEVLTSIGEVS